MAPTGNRSRVVRTWQPKDAPTGEVHFETDDGRTWKTVPYFSEPITGVDRGRVDWSTGTVRRLP